MDKKYFSATTLLDFNSSSIQELIVKRKWKSLISHDRIHQIYTFVRDEILFGYNSSDDIKASQVLKDGYGQCNTKATLLMALLRAVDVPCRFHGFTIDKALQKGAIHGIWYWLAPKNILHSWVEVYYQSKWVNLEGVIIDKKFLNRIQNKYKNHQGNFCGYGIYTTDLQNPEIDWLGESTYIQSLGINNDFGVFDGPDEFYKMYGQELSKNERIIFDLVIRKFINRNVESIRNNG